MPWAGFCNVCGHEVWLAADGSCQNGHPASAISGVHDTDCGHSGGYGGEGAPTRSPMSRSKVIAIIAAIAFVVMALGVLAVQLIPLMLSSSTDLAQEWTDRVGHDYPGFKIVGFNSQSLTATNGSWERWTFALVPPGRDFSVGVSYVSNNSGSWTVEDEVLRPAGRFHDRAASLLDTIDAQYVQRDRDVTVRSDAN
jgi:hypothetical protein